MLETWPVIDLGDGRTKHSIRTKNVGTFVEDLPSVRATGRRWEFYAVVDLVVEERGGRVVGVEEWYHRDFHGKGGIRERDGMVS